MTDLERINEELYSGNISKYNQLKEEFFENNEELTFTIKDICEAWTACYGENLLTECKGFIQYLITK
jgi:hypothetical protein